MRRLLGRYWTIRVRLAALYGTLFVVAGLILVAATYLLVAQRLEQAYIPLKQEDAIVLDDSLKGPNGELSEQAQRRLAEQKTKLRESYELAQREFRAETRDMLLTQGLIAFGVVSLAAIWLGWMITGRAMRPIKQITATAQRVAERSLHERIGLGGPPDELRELADTFDAMLERLDRSFDGQRRFVANASHELRTPLAINRTLLEVALSRPDVCAGMLQLGHTLLEVNGRNERLIDGLLTLARSEAAPAPVEAVDLASVAAHVLDQVRGEAPTLAIRSTLQAAPTSGDPVMLERLTFNLVQNALRYNTPTGWVSVTTHHADTGVRLVVANTGPVVAAYEVPRLFEPFRRLADRVGSARGAGLGLSIVESVARSHGGTVKASANPGGGLTVQVTLPAGPRLPSPA